jgi:hypothetical protein
MARLETEGLTTSKSNLSRWVNEWRDEATCKAKGAKDDIEYIAESASEGVESSGSGGVVTASRLLEKCIRWMARSSSQIAFIHGPLEQIFHMFDPILSIEGQHFLGHFSRDDEITLLAERWCVFDGLSDLEFVAHRFVLPMSLLIPQTVFGTDGPPSVPCRAPP